MQLYNLCMYRNRFSIPICGSENRMYDGNYSSGVLLLSEELPDGLSNSTKGEIAAWQDRMRGLARQLSEVCCDRHGSCEATAKEEGGGERETER